MQFLINGLILAVAVPNDYTSDPTLTSSNTATATSDGFTPPNQPSNGQIIQNSSKLPSSSKWEITASFSENNSHSTSTQISNNVTPPHGTATTPAYPKNNSPTPLLVPTPMHSLPGNTPSTNTNNNTPALPPATFGNTPLININTPPSLTGNTPPNNNNNNSPPNTPPSNNTPPSLTTTTPPNNNSPPLPPPTSGNTPPNNNSSPLPPPTSGNTPNNNTPPPFSNNSPPENNMPSAPSIPSSNNGNTPRNNNVSPPPVVGNTPPTPGTIPQNLRAPYPRKALNAVSGRYSKYRGR